LSVAVVAGVIGGDNMPAALPAARSRDGAMPPVSNRQESIRTIFDKLPDNASPPLFRA
jgi:hypothetical protein